MNKPFVAPTIEKVALGRNERVIVWRVRFDTHRSASGLGSTKDFTRKGDAFAFAATIKEVK